jgi:outer membrane protein TolC
VNQIAVLVLATTTAVAPADTSVHRLGLSAVVELAERNAPAVIHALGQVRSTSASVRAAYGAFLPSLSLNASSNRQLPAQPGRTQVVNGQVVILSSEPWSYNTGLNASVALFSGGARIFELQQAHALANVATVDVVQQKAIAGLAAKQQFFNVLASLEAQAAAQALLDLAKQQLAMSVVHLKAHTVTRSDSLRSEILVHNAELDLTSARTARLQAEASLTRLVGAEYLVTAAPDDSLDTATLSVDDATLHDLALDGPSVHQAQSQLEAAKAAARLSWAGYLPSVTASYSRTGNGASSAFDMSGQSLAYSGALRLAVSLPVFDQFQRSTQTTAANAALDDAQAELRDARLAALESLTSSLGSYRSATERVATQTATLEAAEEDLREHQEQYKVGTSTLLDVLNSQATLLQAQRDLIQARYDRRIAKAQLEALTGHSL